MTLAEKTGQLSQFGTSIYSDDEQTFSDHFAEGKVGSYLTIKGASHTNSIQRDLLKATRLPIPAIFADDGILPITPENYKGKRVALVGSLAGYDGKVHLLGGWSCLSDHNHTVSIEEGLRKALSDCEIVYSRGCGITASDDDNITIAEAVKASAECDVIITVVGEEADMSGEANSRSDNKMAKDGKLTVTLTLRNTGNFDGASVVQLYVRDLVGSCVRPVKELKGFEKVFLKSGEDKTVTLTLSASDMAFHNFNMEKVIETGKCKLWVGQSSDDETFEFDFEII